MSVPKKRRTSASRKRRASHHALSSIALNDCSSCGAPVQPHHACKKCGTYNGRSLNTRVTEVADSKPKTPKAKAPASPEKKTAA